MVAGARRRARRARARAGSPARRAPANVRRRSAHTRARWSGTVSATRSQQVGEVELHAPVDPTAAAPTSGPRSSDRSGRLRRRVDAERRRPARTPLRANARERAPAASPAAYGGVGRRPRARRSTGASAARTAASASGSASTRSRSRAKRCHCAGSPRTSGTAGGKTGTYTLAHGLPRHAHARGGASVRSVGDIDAVVCLVAPEVHAHRDVAAVGGALLRERVGAGLRRLAPRAVAVIAQRRDEVGEVVGPRATHGARHGQPVIRDRRGEPRRPPRVEVVPASTSGDATVQSVREADAIRDRRAVADRARGPRAVARLDDPAAVRVGDEERREVRLVVVRLAAAALAVGVERVGDHRRARRRRCAPARGRAARDPCRAAPSGWARGSSIVQIFSLPIATPCSFTPCSAPQSHVGCDPTNAHAPRVGDRRGTACAASGRRARAACRSTHLRLVGRPVGVLREQHAARRCARTACRTPLSGTRCAGSRGSSGARGGRRARRRR